MSSPNDSLSNNYSSSPSKQNRLSHLRKDDFEDASDEYKAELLRKHLVSKEERNKSNSNSHSPYQNSQPDNNNTSTDDIEEPEEEFSAPLDVPGADITHHLYAWERQHRNSTSTRPRSMSFSNVQSAIESQSETEIDHSLGYLRHPGGFRRHHIVNKARERGDEEPEIASTTFVDYLLLFGHFAGEELEEIEELSEEDRDEAVRGRSERDSLLPKPIPVRRRSTSTARRGTASITQAVLMLLKSFIGTGILFLGRAFLNGGLYFSTAVIIIIALLNMWAYILLIHTSYKIPGSFGDIGGILYGNKMRLAILASITISQMGFVSAYTVFVAENLRAFVIAVSESNLNLPTMLFIVMQIPILTPLALYRNLTKLSLTALIADAFILIGIVYLFGQESAVLLEKGIAKDVVLFNSKSYPLFMGTAVFAFEGIGLIIPVMESMKEPKKFPYVLSGVMVVLTSLFAGSGFLGYAAFGSQIKTVVISNLPQDDKFVQIVQFLYSIAILLSIPLQLFPAVRIMEAGLFVRSGKFSNKVKWKKNLFRLLIVFICIVVSILGANDLDKFVSLIGSLACVPLCFIYPPLLHLKACARSTYVKAADIAMLIFGVLLVVFTTTLTIASILAEA
ncbi:hypothetical protein E3Q22_02466 [Wallemia mellicola]|uniref:Amino acid transporter transmembrane domain-containing protein n=2 Tax=Wallemia mellicola TaxID=1708541 RepID=A0A4T0TK15_9BASI|nr:hypothetical protein WALSEDRAFT_65883 [Wallemia mellicola CBS 633.66]TIB71583.1 hypothetical protein E3Q24_02234 [Wallemia mellicola]EIM19885.1 hypothetical protein WALSEDRAFT_65883 [Wallemia mellicola CBS 633.66]TIB75790.1 hypothetical protein E3Q23_02194 [Wallemia mellicola]TIB78678.1 hypothetical protein E3Q22_02466 [Wallemia mellicola]TIB84203.1 hypothetical protein E3Q21_02499 [Wallemia mellicola]|eukprot:XP_006960027.1 hypothetical protein WALSEDRAFT_65883 [Wallemia mellicola CBS 633.66]